MRGATSYCDKIFSSTTNWHAVLRKVLTRYARDGEGKNCVQDLGE